MPATETVHTQKFKARAKSLYRAVKAADPEGLTRIRPYFDNLSEFKLTQAQLVIAREMHCQSWRELVAKQDWANCSYCRKWQYERRRLVAGPQNLVVCDQCMHCCNEVMQNL